MRTGIYGMSAALLVATFGINPPVTLNEEYDDYGRPIPKNPPYHPPKANDAAHIAKAEAKRRRRAVKRMRQMLDQCEGSDDPEERCPRHPDDCVCWKIHAALKGGEGNG